MEKPEALRLAEYLEQDPCSKAHHDEAATELRRLRAENTALAAALAQEQAEPLTEEEIERICEAYHSPRQLARAIERAHGIGEQP